MLCLGIRKLKQGRRHEDKPTSSGMARLYATFARELYLQPYFNKGLKDIDHY